ncbi:protein kinase [Nonomuraea sp. ATR24]|uniref:WD40 repeat domain-containing serine/threonine protein kinase n=1 Tax=Nonomuraea sp. ATR24 TaxID=1676744 RepID=UPI0035BFCA12
MPDIRPLRPGDPERIGGYRLTGVLGSGGQGVVYHGTADDGRPVAIKLLHSHLGHDDDVTRGFLREVEAARRVAAFCTAAVLDVGTLDERPYIVSEYVAGDTLQALVRSSGPRTGGGLDRLAIATLTALAAIHRAGIVHRDFKPGNVLMGPEGPTVIDFGIAKALGATTHASGPVGTPTYMSPEQFTGERVGPASDVFSWAGTMVFAATGRPPFAGGTVPVILNAILTDEPDLTGVPPHLAEPIRACLAKSPAARPAPADLLAALTQSGAPDAAQRLIPRPDHPAGQHTPAPHTPAPHGPYVPAPGTGQARPSGQGPYGAPQDAGQGPAQGGGGGGGHAGRADRQPEGAYGAAPGTPQAQGPYGPGAPVPPFGPPGAGGPERALPPGPGARTASSSGGPETVAGRGGAVSRRVLIGGVAATAAAAVSAFAILRPGSGVFEANGPADPTVTGTARTASPGTTGSTGTTGTTGTATAGATPTATDGTPGAATAPATAAPQPVPFGSFVVEPVTLPRGSGTPVALAASGARVACGTGNGTVLTWDLSTTATAARVARLGDGGAAVTCVACEDGDRVVSGHADGRMRVWGPDARHGAGDPIIGVTLAGGKAVAISQKYDLVRDLYSVARLWDVAGGEQLGKPMGEHFQGIGALAFGRLDGRDVLVTADGRNRVRVRGLSGGGVSHDFRTGDVGGVERLACVEREGRTLLVSTHLDATLRVHDLASGKRSGKWSFGARGTAALVAGLLDGVPVAVVAHSPGGGTYVRVWNLDTGEVIGELLTTGPEVRALALAEVTGRPVVAGAAGGVLYVWSLGGT